MVKVGETIRFKIHSRTITGKVLGLIGKSRYRVALVGTVVMNRDVVFEDGIEMIVWDDEIIRKDEVQTFGRPSTECRGTITCRCIHCDGD